MRTAPIPRGARSRGNPTGSAKLVDPFGAYGPKIPLENRRHTGLYLTPIRADGVRLPTQEASRAWMEDGAIWYLESWYLTGPLPVAIDRLEIRIVDGHNGGEPYVQVVRTFETKPPPLGDDGTGYWLTHGDIGVVG